MALSIDSRLLFFKSMFTQQCKAQIGLCMVASNSTSYVAHIILSAAPLPPQDVSAVLVTPVILRVSWSRPARIRGDVVYYTVYAIPFASQVSPSARKKRQADHSLGTIAKVSDMSKRQVHEFYSLPNSEGCTANFLCKCDIMGL